MKTLAFLLLSCSLASAQVQQSITIFATGNYTTPSLGEFNNSAVIEQSNRTSAGAGAAYELRRHGNGIVADYSFTPTGSDLAALNPAFKSTKIGHWPLDRNKLDAMYEHRFRAKSSVHPYLGLGGFLVILWGGNAPAHSNVNATGWDAWGGEVTTGGFIFDLSPRFSFRTGALLDVGRATTYGDTTYRASQNLMIEPQVGITWMLTKPVSASSQKH
jgi:hypothetical protein